jgi:hypothetical protein
MRERLARLVGELNDAVALNADEWVIGLYISLVRRAAHDVRMDDVSHAMREPR